MPDQRKNIISLFNKYAVSYHEKYQDISQYIPAINHFCASIKKENPRILEVACGPGNITAYIRRQIPGAEICAIDIADDMIAFAKERVPDIDFRVMDCRDIDQLDQQFDGVVAGFCMPYLSKAEAIKLIRKAGHILLPQASIYLSTMEGRYADSGYESASTEPADRLFIHYHEAPYLQAALTDAGFTSIEMSRVPNHSLNGKTTDDLVMTAIR